MLVHDTARAQRAGVYTAAVQLTAPEYMSADTLNTPRRLGWRQ